MPYFQIDLDYLDKEKTYFCKYFLTHFMSNKNINLCIAKTFF